MRLVTRSDVGLANRMVSMTKVLRLIDYPDADYAGSGAKVECPFGAIYHPDGGKSFRVYDDEGAYCYACSERFTPVQLYAKYLGLDPDVAAGELLEAVGYKEPDADERIAAALADTFTVDQPSLEEALKKWCQRNYPEWEILQFADDQVAAKYRQCVELLPSVSTREDVKIWLGAAKTAMGRVLGEKE